MNLSFLSRSALMAGVAACAFVNAPAFAQDAEPVSQQNQPDPQDDDEPGTASGGGIVVEGQRLRGQLDVEQAPILELGEAEIAAEGVASIADLITQITSQTGSSRGRGGGQPVILINGIRIGSFREFAQYPPEALERVEVFPEEVAQRFGFPPDRRVINLILKDNYRNAEVELEFEGPSRGGNYTREQELGFLQISDGARINVNLTAQDTSFLTEDERDIIQTAGSISDVPGDPDQAAFRSLISDSRSLEGNISWAKAFIDSGISVSANAAYDRGDQLALQGLNTVLLTDADGNSALRTFGEDTPLQRRVASDTASASGSLNAPVNAFQLTATLDASLSETETVFDQFFDTSALEAAALAGDIAIDDPLPTSVETGFDIANRRAITTESLATLRGPLAYLPGGEITATFDIGADWRQIESSDTRSDISAQLTRRRLSTGANLAIPITSRNEGFADALGSFTLNLQAGFEDLSDFGILGDYTAGLNWAPFDNLDLSATYIFREVAPALSALGDPQIVNLNTPVFDFTNGETVLATVITGGNPDLLAETQTDWKFAANWELPFWEGTRFQVEYIRNRSDDVVSSFPQVTPDIEAAFPDRIIRDTGGRLVSVDRRSVTFAETRADRLNFSLNFRGSIGAGSGEGGGPGGAGGRGRGGDGSGSGGRGQGRPDTGSGGPPPGAPAGGAFGGPPSPEQRAAFMQFRERICADDGMEVLTRLATALANGEDLSDTVPGFDAQRFQGLLSRIRNEDGSIDPDRLAVFRERICSFDPASMGGRANGGEGGPPGGPPGDPPSGPMGETFAAFREIACGEDGEARIRALVARIDAGEDVSDELPGFDPNMAGFILDRLRGEDGTVSSERIAQLKERFCSSEGAAQQGGGRPGGGGPPGGGFNPLAGGRNVSGFRYFVSLNHTIELENSILIAPGLDPLDQLDGQATSAFGLPRHTSRLEAGLFGQGMGLRLSGRYTGSTRLDGSGLPGSSDIFFDDLATFDVRIFANLDELFGSESAILENVRVSLRADNVFDAQLRVVDENGNTPTNYQQFLIDPVGRFVGIDIRKLF